MKAPKIVFWDVETSPMLVESFTLYPESINHSGIIHDWHMICATVLEQGKKKAISFDKTQDAKRFKKDPRDDYHVVKALRDYLEDADVLVAHNGDAFDLKKLNARLIFHGIAPLPPIKTVDTLKEARKIAKFSSNRLDYLIKLAGGEGKTETSKGLWTRASAGDRKAIKEMVAYNVDDVFGLQLVFEWLSPYMKNSISLPSHDMKCPNMACGSSKIQRRGTYSTRVGQSYQRFVCFKCGAWGRERVASIPSFKSEIVGI